MKLVRKSNIYLHRFEEVTAFTILLDFSKNFGTRADGIYESAFVGECGADEDGVSREFYSSNVDDSCQPITEAFLGAKFKIY